MSVLVKDKIFLPLDKIFNLSKVGYSLQSIIDKETFLTYNKPFNSKSYTKYIFKNLNFVKTLNSHIVGLVFDKTKLVI